MCLPTDALRQVEVPSKPIPTVDGEFVDPRDRVRTGKDTTHGHEDDVEKQPSIGVLLCASKNHEVVEYALSRTMSPALVSEYQTRLPDKRLLQAKLHEFYELAQEQAALPDVASPKPVTKKESRKSRKP